VQSLLAASRETGDSYDLDIFVADNDSAIDDQRQLQLSLAELAGVHLQVNSTNRGFAEGHNNNLESIFLHSRPEYIWILNNDCLVFKDTLVSLIECAGQNPNVGIWGATLLEQDGETIQCAGGCFYNSWISSYRQYGQGTSLIQIDQLGVVDFDYIAGASLFCPSATLQGGLREVSPLHVKEGMASQQWLNEDFFLYFEELDLAKRLQPGLGMGWCKRALIKHEGGVSTGTGDNRRTVMSEYHSTLSALRFTRLHYPGQLWFMAPARYIAKCMQLVLKGEIHLLAPLTRAYRDFWSE
jgi:hypothetical protein